MRRLIVGILALAALPAASLAQVGGELILHNKGQFKGSALRITGPRTHLNAFVVKSATLPAGTQWELCSGNKFTGCRQLGQSDPGMVMTVRSVRPIAPVLTSRAPIPTSGTFRGPSLRGIDSEYFVTPDRNGHPVEVPSATGEATSGLAQEFCRARGWRSAAHARLQTIGGKLYLADVLCVNTAD